MARRAVQDPFDPFGFRVTGENTVRTVSPDVSSDTPTLFFKIHNSKLNRNTYELRSHSSIPLFQETSLQL